MKADENAPQRAEKRRKPLDNGHKPNLAFPPQTARKMEEFPPEPTNIETNSTEDLAQDRLEKLGNEARNYLQKGNESFVRVGKILLEARELHRDNKAFGKWCSDNLSGLSQRAAHRLMQVAKQFTGQDVTNIPLSGLYELAAPKNDNIRGPVMKKLHGRESVTLKDVRDEIDANQRPDLPRLNTPESKNDQAAVEQFIASCIPLQHLHDRKAFTPNEAFQVVMRIKSLMMYTVPLLLEPEFVNFQ